MFAYIQIFTCFLHKKPNFELKILLRQKCRRSMHLGYSIAAKDQHTATGSKWGSRQRSALADFCLGLFGIHYAGKAFCPQIKFHLVPSLRIGTGMGEGADAVGQSDNVEILMVGITNGAVHTPVGAGTADDDGADALCLQLLFQLGVSKAGVGILGKIGIITGGSQCIGDLAIRVPRRSLQEPSSFSRPRCSLRNQ